jgi:hypothetical protein
MEEKRKQRVEILTSAKKGYFDEHEADKRRAGVDRLEKYSTLDEVLLLCRELKCSEDEALAKDDIFLTMLIARNIENRIFEIEFNRILRSKHKK